MTLEVGISKKTAKLLECAGLDTRQKVIDAGEIEWLKLPRFGKKCLDEVNAWLGDDAPRKRRELERCISTLEKHGYSVTKKPNA